MRARNAIANQITKLSMDEFDALIAGLSREKDYHQKLIAAMQEIILGLKNSPIKSELDAILEIQTQKKSILDAMLTSVQAGNPDVEGLANNLMRLSQLEGMQRTGAFQKIMDIHQEIDPARKQQLVDDLRASVRSEELRLKRDVANQFRNKDKAKKDILDAESSFLKNT